MVHYKSPRLLPQNPTPSKHTDQRSVLLPQPFILRLSKPQMASKVVAVVSNGMSLAPILVVLVVTLLFSTGAMSQSDCTNTIISMASCLNYIQGTSETPPNSCCTALANVVQTNPRCLCLVLKGGSQFGISVNVTRALSLPDACHVQTPPVSRCDEVLAPAPGPGGFSPAEKGSKITPGGDTSSAAKAKKKHILQVLVGFFVLLASSSCMSKLCFVV